MPNASGTICCHDKSADRQGSAVMAPDGCRVLYQQQHEHAASEWQPLVCYAAWRQEGSAWQASRPAQGAT